MAGNTQIKASQIAKFLKAKLVGQDVFLKKADSLSKMKNNCFCFAEEFKEKNIDIINKHPLNLIICHPKYKDKIRASFILSENPRFDFMQAVRKFFFSEEKTPGIHPTALIDKKAKLGENLSIGANVFIGPDVLIGNGCVILQNVVLINRVVLGKNCFIMPNAVIGGRGFGHAFDKKGIPEACPHIGGVKIGNNVDIGVSSAIDRGTLGDTCIKDNVKIDNLVHVAHNCTVGENTMIAAGATLCGSVNVGKKCWIGAASSVRERLKVGDGSFVGLGAVVVKDVAPGVVVVGNPARIFVKKR